MKPRVNLYIESSIHGPVVKTGGYGYVIEFKKHNGIPVTREGFGSQDNSTENRLILAAFCEACSRLTKPCSIQVFTSCRHIRNAYENKWMEKWEKNSWENAKGAPVKNVDLWKKATYISREHDLSFLPENSGNPFKEWLLGEIWRFLERP